VPPIKNGPQGGLAPFQILIVYSIETEAAPPFAIFEGWDEMVQTAKALIFRRGRNPAAVVSGHIRDSQDLMNTSSIYGGLAHPLQI
jgi:hypothetical protein